MIRLPSASDARAVHALIERCPPLDRNSLYCNLLQCSHFAHTCALAETAEPAASASRVSGFVSGYVEPESPGTLFIWQVAVGEEARGQRLGERLIRDILARPICAKVRAIETTVTPENKASLAMFHGLAERLNAKIETRVVFDKEVHFGGHHESEILLTISPVAPLAATP